MSRTCGQCKWFTPAGVDYADVMVCRPPMPLAFQHPTHDVVAPTHKTRDATNCECFAPRVCETCHCMKYVAIMKDGKQSGVRECPTCKKEQP